MSGAVPSLDNTGAAACDIDAGTAVVTKAPHIRVEPTELYVSSSVRFILLSPLMPDERGLFGGQKGHNGGESEYAIPTFIARAAG
jgi:hypothetical protein